jgi:hypothetical protein
MGFYENGNRHVEIVGITMATCDLCHTMKESETAVLTIQKAPIEQGFNQYKVVEAVALSNRLRIEMNLQGWTSETFHGTTMILCPKCSAL